MIRLRFLLISLGSLCWAFPGTAQTAPSKWVSYDAASKTVTFALQAGAPGTSGPFNFNGYNNGGATLVVPAGSTVVMNFVNMDGTPHSAELIADTDPLPTMGGDPAIPAAYTKDVTQGLPQGGRRHSVYRPAERKFPNLLRRSRSRTVRHVDPVQGGSGGQVAQLGDIVDRSKEL